MVPILLIWSLFFKKLAKYARLNTKMASLCTSRKFGGKSLLTLGKKVPIFLKLVANWSLFGPYFFDKLVLIWSL